MTVAVSKNRWLSFEDRSFVRKKLRRIGKIEEKLTHIRYSKENSKRMVRAYKITLQEKKKYGI